MTQPIFIRSKKFSRHTENNPLLHTSKPFKLFDTKSETRISNLGKSLILGSCLSAFSGAALANTADHHIEFDGWKLISVGEAHASGDQAQSKEILANTSYKAKWEYTGTKKNCTKVVNWKLKKLQPQQVTNFAHDLKTATIQESEPGNYELTVVTEGYDGRYFYNLLGCNNTAEGLVETTVKLTINDDLYTDTKHPILLIPGVLGYDKMLGDAYFYRVGRAIESSSNQNVEDISLDPWLNTEDRGYQLAERIVDYLIVHDKKFDTSGTKVNLLAHSHGSTTSRMALRILAQAFPGEKSKVASLTTVAGPHYGTPTADGAQWVLENWAEVDNTINNDGLFFINQVLFFLGDFASLGISLLSWQFYEPKGIQDVLVDFTQRGMARFNTCYPSAGLQNDVKPKYFIEDNFEPDTHKINNSEKGTLIDIARSSDGLNADITVNKCQNYSWNGEPNVKNDVHLASGQIDLFSETANIQLTNDPNEAYGVNEEHPEYDPNAPGSFGNGLGTKRESWEPDAIRYYSMTGRGEWNTSFGFGSGQNPLELADPIIALFHSAHKFVGARTTEQNWPEWRKHLLDTYQTGEPVDREGLVSENTPAGISTGYAADSDGFIPVKSTRFGQYIGTFGSWNHVDEQNGLFGWVAKGKEDADPIAVYREHANRLKNDGL